jgi:hypothetical protein
VGFLMLSCILILFLTQYPFLSPSPSFWAPSVPIIFTSHHFFTGSPFLL